MPFCIDRGEAEAKTVINIVMKTILHDYDIGHCHNALAVRA